MKRTFKTLLSDRRGLALITVVGTLALATILLIAIFSVTQTEYKATQSFAAGQSAKQLADEATAIVQAQIQNGQNPIKTSYDNTRTTHATQPGCVRVYANDGSFLKGYKLYSSSEMVMPTAGVTGEQYLTQGKDSSNKLLVPLDWDSAVNSARFVDLNEPVVRPPLVAGAKASVYFPIIDPRAYFNFLGPPVLAPLAPAYGVPTTQVEGFSYTAGTVNGVVLPATGADETKLRVPMPVEWIYQLQDGTMGTLDADNKFVSAPAGINATVDNPIVGRVAFWTDDESCKINVNTASEPTYAGTPFYYHERDRRWAHFPAASSEYQRYPGHPATVALSAVLLPNYRLDPLRPDPGLSTTDVIDIKEQLYSLAPKVELGGSKSGSRPYGLDAFSAGNGEVIADAVSTNTSRNERLYASVDEMLFKDGDYDAVKGRSASKLMANGRDLFDHDALERSRFFLTANSRSPEFSIHGFPRIAMWPIADESLGADRRSNFDNLIALCARIAAPSAVPLTKSSYIFRRAQAQSATYDITGGASGFATTSSTVTRNRNLLQYLENQMSQLSFPKTSSVPTSSNNNFADKYGVDNVRQLSTAIFDYVRCINLYDGMLARSNDGSPAAALDTSTFVYGTQNALEDIEKLYNLSSGGPGGTPIAFKTFTNPRATTPATAGIDLTKSNITRVLPGHGAVTPIIWDQGGKSYRGFGRFFTVTEVGMHVICTADGLNDIDPAIVPLPAATTPRHYPVDFNGVKSGGQSSARIGNTETGYNADNATEYPGYKLPAPAGPTGPYARWWSNFPPLSSNGPKQEPTAAIMGKYGVNASAPGNPDHPSKHPGFNPQLWNLTLDEDTPLEEDEKRVQAMLELETFCPSLGWTKFFPEFTIVVDGTYATQIMIKNGKGVEVPLFNTNRDIPIKSNNNLFENTDVYSVGGGSGVEALYSGRRCNAPGAVKMGSDYGYDSTVPRPHTGLSNFELVSDFVTVKRDAPLIITFPNQSLKIKIYDSHDIANRQPIQIINIQFPTQLVVPTPRLVGADDATSTIGNYRDVVDSAGNLKYWRRQEGPHWWCFNWGGCLDRVSGKASPLYSNNPANKAKFWLTAPKYQNATQRTRGRLETDGTEKKDDDTNTGRPGSAQGLSLLPSLPDTTKGESTNNPSYDVTRTLVPVLGDYRILAAMYDVPTSMWQPHPLWNSTTLRGANNYCKFWSNVSGSKISTIDETGATRYNILVASQGYSGGRMPDIPNDLDVSKVANAFGDFDAGISSAKDGPYINKPDEGNFQITSTTKTNVGKLYRKGYFYDSWQQTDDWRNGVFITPNRLVSSPVMLGSLPTCVWPGSAVSGSGAAAPALGLSNATSYQPWQTLLFRPYVKNVITGAVQSQAVHPGERNPQDHYLLDMFFMPVVEPYAISEPLSEAGKININYQIQPFSYIRRATGMHAVLKGEFMTAIPNADAEAAKNFKANPATWSSQPEFYSETDGKYWHRPLDPVNTLKAFDERMNFTDGSLQANQKGLFRSASQICELHMIPLTGLGANDTLYTSTFFNGLTSASARKTKMEKFWSEHATTGENVREKTYSNIYSRITTRSNTFRVHVRSQVVKKARSTAANTFDPAKDAVLSEYRGSTVLERFIDSTNTAIPDYAIKATPLNERPLDTFYQFRTLETKRFAP
ncbi:hypothetical protein BH11VER1_BH11VER1_17190 [soil metagenome]